MLKRATVLSLVVGLLCVPLLAQAQLEPRYYVGGDLTNWTYSRPDTTNGRQAGLRARAGVELYPLVGIEGHLFTGGSDQVMGAPANGVPQLVDLSLNWGGAALLRGGLMLPFYPRLVVFGNVGVTTARITARMQAGTARDTETGLAYGAGLEFVGTDHVFLNIDWMSYLDDTYSLNALNFGLRYRF